MEWLSQNWIWLALGIGIIYLMNRGSLGRRFGGYAGHDHGKASGREGGNDGCRPAAPASDAGQPGGVAAADTAGSGTGAGATPARGATGTHRRHGCC